MVYFISGHRDLTEEEFYTHYVQLIDEVMRNDAFAEFVVGDWEGCDTMALEYLVTLPRIPWTTIYCIDNPRVQLFGSNPTNFEEIDLHGCNTYDECDAEMTKCSDFDIAWIRPGREDSHTAKNIKRRYGIK